MFPTQSSLIFLDIRVHDYESELCVANSCHILMLKLRKISQSEYDMEPITTVRGCFLLCSTEIMRNTSKNLLQVSSHCMVKSLLLSLSWLQNKNKRNVFQFFVNVDMNHKVTQKELSHGLIPKANPQTSVNFLSVFCVWVHNLCPNLLWAGMVSDWPVFHRSLSSFQWGPKRWALEGLSDVGKSDGQNVNLEKWWKKEMLSLWVILKKTLYNKETTKVLMIFDSDFISLARNKRWDWFYLFLSSLKGIKHPTSSAQNTAPPLYQVASFSREIWKLLKLLGNIGWKKMLACIKEGVCPNGLPAQLHWMGCRLSSWNERHRAVILLMGSQWSHTALTEEM